jgi:parallel beta-helix repeat protein
MSNKAQRFGVAALIAAIATISVLAGVGRTPIWAPVVIAPGSEGKYIVTRDVVGSPGSPVILILPGTMAVDIDLNGFSLLANGADAINAQGVDSLTVRNGTLMGGLSGIWAAQCRKVVVEDVKIQVVQMDGIALREVDSFALRRNIILNAAVNGILVDGAFIDPSTTSTGAIDDNVLRECGRAITLYNGSSVGIKDNRIETTTMADGLFISPGPGGGIIGCGSCLVADNTIQEARVNGMWLSNFRGGKLHDNEIISAGFNQGGQGIWLDQGSDNNLVLSNVVSECGGNGVLVMSNGNHIERNVMNRNGMAGGWGLFIQGGASNTYRGNTAQFNLGVLMCPTTDFCNAGPGNNSPGDNFMPNLL